MAHQANQPLPAPMDTSLNITSFGRDAIGELYVVGAHGTVHRYVRDVTHRVNACERAA